MNMTGNKTMIRSNGIVVVSRSHALHVYPQEGNEKLAMTSYEHVHSVKFATYYILA